jgi:hypothetical protein
LGVWGAMRRAWEDRRCFASAKIGAGSARPGQKGKPSGKGKQRFPVERRKR